MKTTALIIVGLLVLVIGIFLAISERKNTDVRKIVLIGVMTAMSVGGRLIFAPFPGFKPVTAIVVITGIYLGAEAGFYCGALTPLITNFYFGQGPYTPFQMLIWGMIGVAAALLCEPLKQRRWFLYGFGALAGVVFSLLMDVYSVIWAFGHFQWEGYLTYIGFAAPFTGIYCVSNVIFLAVLTRPLGKKIQRVTTKYQIPC